MSEKKRIELTKLQGIIAIASFSSGVIIASVCLFLIPPLGEIANSAISIVSELLVLCGAILGVRFHGRGTFGGLLRLGRRGFVTQKFVKVIQRKRRTQRRIYGFGG